jgi:mannose-6-phosphate isomerase-like protein (cupin superfamily)
MIRVIDIGGKPVTKAPGGAVRMVLNPAEDGTRVGVAVRDVGAGQACHLGPSDRTRVAYIFEGEDATITHTTADSTATYDAGWRTGIYLEPGEDATIEAKGSELLLLLFTVPKHTGRATGPEAPAGYFFDESRLRVLVDEKGFRRRTFWVNKETGLSNAWDLQLGRMQYAPHAHSPRHVHHASRTNPVTPEHFYLIEEGTGQVKHDSGSLPVGPGSLVLIPAGEWHQLVASETGFDYIEFQAPFDFVTTMDHDPLGKNWYISGTDDGTGKPKLWVQS